MCSCQAKLRGSVFGIAVTLPDLLKPGGEPARPRAEVELGVRTELAVLQQTKPGQGPARRDFVPWSSVHVAIAGWLCCAVPCLAGLGRVCRQLSNSWGVPGAALAQGPSASPAAAQEAPCSPPNPALYLLPLLSAAPHGCSSSGPSADTLSSFSCQGALRFHVRGPPAKLGWRWRGELGLLV